MLTALEQKVASVIDDVLAGRPALSVVRASAPLPPPPAGAGVARVALSQVEAEHGFGAEATAHIGPGAQSRSRRVLPVRFTASVAFFRRPETDDDAGHTAGRNLLLEDLSSAGHALGSDAVQSGQAFETATPDPGFRVRSFRLGEGAINPGIADGLLSGTLTFSGQADLWPVGESQPEGVIAGIDVLATALPLTFTVDDAVVVAGSTTTVRIALPERTRLSDAESGSGAPERFAVFVLSDLPPAERGGITSGTPGVEEGVRLVTVTGGAATVTYQAPAGDLGAVRVEQVAVRMARPDGTAGLLLGSVILRLAPGANS